MNSPLIRIEVEHMRQSMVHAFSKHTIQMDDMFRHAIEQALKPEVVQVIMMEAASKYLAQVIDEEIQHFLKYGQGRQLVRAEVEKRLSADFGGGQASDGIKAS